ncbi:MAG: hypothetical protein ABIB98_03715 [bacterium]
MQKKKIAIRAILDKTVKFRKEDRYILMFSCKKMQHYRISQEFWCFMLHLKKGLGVEDISILDKDTKELFDDLKSLKLVNCCDG